MPTIYSNKNSKSILPSNISAVFVDTNVFVALRDNKDSTHSRADRLLKLLLKGKVKFYTSSDVVGETMTVLSMKLGKSHAEDLLQDVIKLAFKVLFIDPEIHNEARELFFRVKSKNISFIDCTSIVAMRRNHIPWAFTFDEHFRTGKIRLLEDAVAN